YNDYSINIVDGTDEQIVVDHDAKTITLTLDLSGTASSDISQLDVYYTGTNPGTGAFTFSGNASGLDGTAAGNGLATTAGGADPTVQITLDDGSGTTQTVTVAADATSVTIDSGRFAGLSFDVTDLENLDPDEDSISIKIT